MSSHPHTTSVSDAATLEGGERDERLHGEAHETAGVQFGPRRRPAQPRIACATRPTRENAAERAQIVQHVAVGGRREPRAPLPLNLLVQGERIRHVDDKLIAVVVTHPRTTTRIHRLHQIRMPSTV